MIDDQVVRVSARDPWFNLPFKGLVEGKGKGRTKKWFDLRASEGSTVRRELPAKHGVCCFCFGWRVRDSAEPCYDPPLQKSAWAGEVPHESGCVSGVKAETFGPSTQKLGLYWCTTEDHDEDWFVVARTKRRAEQLHEDMEGYDRGDAFAERVARVPVQWLCHSEGWPNFNTSILEDCGGVQVVYSPDPDPLKRRMRDMMGVPEGAWSFNGTIYTPGDIVENAHASLSDRKNSN